MPRKSYRFEEQSWVGDIDDEFRDRSSESCILVNNFEPTSLFDVNATCSRSLDKQLVISVRVSV